MPKRKSKGTAKEHQPKEEPENLKNNVRCATDWSNKKYNMLLNLKNTDFMDISHEGFNNFCDVILIEGNFYISSDSKFLED